MWTRTSKLLIPWQHSYLTESRIKLEWIWKTVPSLAAIQLNCPISQDADWWQHIKAEIIHCKWFWLMPSMGTCSPLSLHVHTIPCYSSFCCSSKLPAYRKKHIRTNAQAWLLVFIHSDGDSPYWRKLKIDFQSHWMGTWSEHKVQKTPDVSVYCESWKYLRSVAEIWRK